MSHLPTYAIVLASGVGARFGGTVPKQYLRFRGKMVIEHTLEACNNGLFDRIILVVSEAYRAKMEHMISRNAYSTPVQVVAGGDTRQESCKRGIEAIADEEARIIIHNGIQPFVTKENIERCLQGLEECSAVTSAVPCVYTVLKVDENNTVVDMPARRELFNDMGVECFRLSLLRRLFSDYEDDVSTDIIGMIFRSGLSKVKVVEGDPQNIKITHKEDIILARQIFKERNNGKDKN